MKLPILAAFRNIRKKRSSTGNPAKAPVRRVSLGVEEMEARVVMSFTSIWNFSSLINKISYFLPQPTAAGRALINGLADSTIRSTALADYNRDGQITRNDMMDILQTGSNQYTFLTSTGYHDLLVLVGNGATVAMPDYVQNLANKVLTTGPAYSYYASGLMNYYWWNSAYYVYDNLAATFVGQQVNDYFLGQNRPDPNQYDGQGNVTLAGTYTQVTDVPLFNGTPKYQDVAQGGVGDCWLMASLAEVAARNPSVIQNMFIDNRDGTFTVRFYHNGTPDYVTVDNYLPDGGTDYDNPRGSLWPALAEKAFAQENGAGWLGSNSPGSNSYQALNNGSPTWALPAITGKAATLINVSWRITYPNFQFITNVSSITSAWNQGQYVVLCTSSPSSSLVVPDHCYALVGISNNQFTMFNPWGTYGGYSGSDGNYYPGYFTGSATDVVFNFSSWGQAGAAAVNAQAPAAWAVSSRAASNHAGSIRLADAPKLQGTDRVWTEGRFDADAAVVAAVHQVHRRVDPVVLARDAALADVALGLEGLGSL